MEFRFLLSAAAFCVLLLRPVRASWVIAPVITAALCLHLRSRGYTGKSVRTTKKRRLATWGLSLLAALVFAAVWLRSLRLVSLQFFDWKASLPVLTAAVISTPLAVPFLARCLSAASELTDFGESTLTGHDSSLCLTGEDHRMLLCTAIVTVSLVSLCSPIYPFNDWVDANCFFTVGKSMLYGIVPYRDLYEQKGPLLYALYALAYPVSHTSFLGAWLLECAAAYAFLLSSYRVFLILYGRKDPLFLLLTSAIVYTVPAFLKGGSAEELTLPLLMPAMYYGLYTLKTGKDLRGRDWLIIGLTSGAVLWIKYSMLGFYLGFILLPAWQLLKKKQAGGLFTGLLMILLGVVLISVPVLGYFGYHKALDSLWEVYFYNNLFVYGRSSTAFSTVKGLLSGAASMLTWNDSTILLVLFAVAMLLRKGEKKPALFLMMTFFFAFIVIYAGGITLKYYSEILCIFVPVGLAELWPLLGGKRTEAGARTTAEGSTDVQLPGMKAAAESSKWMRIVLPLLFVLALLGSDNVRMLGTRREEMPQYRFDRILAETPDATLFNYGALDIGQYTVSDILPSTRFFCMLNLPSEEMFREMEHYMADGVTDYIVSRGLEVDSPCYELVDSVEFPNENTVYPYYLYKRK